MSSTISGWRWTDTAETRATSWWRRPAVIYSSPTEKISALRTPPSTYKVEPTSLQMFSPMAAGGLATIRWASWIVILAVVGKTSGLQLLTSRQVACWWSPIRNKQPLGLVFLLYSVNLFLTRLLSAFRYVTRHYITMYQTRSNEWTRDQLPHNCLFAPTNLFQKFSLSYLRLYNLLQNVTKNKPAALFCTLTLKTVAPSAIAVVSQVRWPVIVP